MKPSRFIMNTNYATTQNDETGSFTLTIPSTWTFNQSSQPLTATYTIGQKSAGMRVLISSSKYPGVNLVSSVVLMPCTEHYYSDVHQSNITINGFLFLSVYRSAAGKVTMRVIPSDPGDWTTGNMTITNAGQTLTCHVSTFLSPFES